MGRRRAAAFARAATVSNGTVKFDASRLNLPSFKGVVSNRRFEITPFFLFLLGISVECFLSVKRGCYADPAFKGI